VYNAAAIKKIASRYAIVDVNPIIRVLLYLITMWISYIPLKPGLGFFGFGSVLFGVLHWP
jgi:hypothetical protein